MGLEIFEIKLPLLGDGAALALVRAPGRDGDLNGDLDAIQHWGAKAVVTLLEHEEAEKFGVNDAIFKERNIEWYHCPIEDFHPPGDAFEDKWADAGPKVRAMLCAGEKVVVHCHGGKGRSGTIAARLLIELRVASSAQDAIRQVREVQPKAVETQDQERYLETIQASPAM